MPKMVKQMRFVSLNPFLSTLLLFTSACDHYNENIIIRDSCTGVVVKKYIDHDNHGAHTLWIQGKGGPNDICYVTTYSIDSICFYNKVVIGDSLIKKPASSLYRIKSFTKDFTCEYKYE